MPAESWPIVKEFAEVCKVRMLASGSYDDDIAMEARGVRLTPLVLLKSLSAEVWAETCTKSNVYYPFRQAHIKYVRCLSCRQA